MDRREALNNIAKTFKDIALNFSKADVKLEAVKVKEGDMLVDVQGELKAG